MNNLRISTAAILLLGAALTTGLSQDETAKKGSQKLRKPSMADTIKANVYADNTFELYINGELVAVDSIRFIPHNVVSVDILPAYPMTIAVMAKDNADSKTGMEYANTNIGDAGFILKLGDGTVTNASWKAKSFFHGPIDRDTRILRFEPNQSPRIGLLWTSTTVHGRARKSIPSRKLIQSSLTLKTISMARSSFGPTTSPSTTR